MLDAFRSLSPARRAVLGGIVLLGLAFYLVQVLHFYRQPLRIEENEWPPMAAAIVDHGEPVIPPEENHRVSINPDLTEERTPYIGAWHPPLYLYVLGGTMLVTGEDASYSLRAVGVLSLLLAALLLIALARELAPERWPIVAAAGVALLLVHPYASQGSTFLDIDTGIYAPIVLLVLYLAVRLARRGGPARPVAVLGLGAAFALVLWAKITTAILVAAVLLLFLGVVRRLRGLGEAAVAVAAGTALFFGTYALWCAATGVPFSYTFEITFVQKQGRLLDPTLRDQAIHWHTAWLFPALLALAGAYLVDLVRRFARERTFVPADILFLFAGAVLVQYTVMSPTDGAYQGKYAFPALPALTLAVSWLLLRREDGTPAWRSVLAGGVAGLVGALLLPDLLTGDRYRVFEDGPGRLGMVAVCVAALAVAWFAAGRRSGTAVLIACAVLLAGQSVRSYRADTSPMYTAPDTTDFEQAVRAVNAALGPGELALVPKDLGFYVHPNRVIERESAFARGDETLERVLRENERITVVAENSFAGPLPGTAFWRAVEECFQDVTVIGTATIRKRTETC